MAKTSHQSEVSEFIVPEDPYELGRRRVREIYNERRQKLQDSQSEGEEAQR